MTKWESRCAAWLHAHRNTIAVLVELEHDKVLYLIAGRDSIVNIIRCRTCADSFCFLGSMKFQHNPVGYFIGVFIVHIFRTAQNENSCNKH